MDIFLIRQIVKERHLFFLCGLVSFSMLLQKSTHLVRADRDGQELP